MADNSLDDELERKLVACVIGLRAAYDQHDSTARDYGRYWLRKGVDESSTEFHAGVLYGQTGEAIDFNVDDLPAARIFLAGYAKGWDEGDDDGPWHDDPDPVDSLAMGLR